MNSLAKNMQISRLDPLLFDVNLGFIEVFWKYKIQKRCTAEHLLVGLSEPNRFTTTSSMSYNYHYATGCVTNFHPV